MYKITVHNGWHGPEVTEELEYEEMIEILAAIINTPIRGNELFDSAKTKARKLFRLMPASNY